MSAKYYEKDSPRMLTALTLLVVAAGAATIAVAAARQAFQSQYAWLSMIGLALFVGPVSTIYIPGIKARVVLGDVVTFTCAALFGPSAAIIAAVADGAVTSLRITSGIRKFSYNVATCAVSMAVSNFATRAAFPSFGANTAGLSIIELLAAMGLFTFCYFLVSTFLVAGFVAVSRRESFIRTWVENFLWTSISYVASGVSALVACLLAERFGYYVIFVPVGMMMLIFLFYRSYFTKVENANKRADSFEELNLRTIETIVASIGAVGYAPKMNIRRVEHLAVELAKAAGCSQVEIKAVRLAAALHDIGNIALPQHILEKPGPLTAEEYERVKTHAVLGARMVESIGFPYPVTDIIRHHHERFDGTGYPANLKAEAIPLGARVLSIIDCYNALTTDRPYRARLSRRCALDVMKEQSGKAFDPALLAEFLKSITVADEEASIAQSEAIEMDELQADIIGQRLSWQAA